MTLNATKLKFVDYKTAILTSGYIKDILSTSKLLNASGDEIIFPSDIKNIIILFLFQMEKFIKCGESITISEHGNILTLKNSNDYCNTIHGKVDIDFNKYPNAIYKWKFNIEAQQASIGIESDPNRKRINDYCFPSSTYDKSRYYYAIGDAGDLEYQDSKGSWDSYDSITGKVGKYVDGIHKSDVIEMILNVSKKTMIFHKNGKDLGVAYNDIDNSKTYHMAICLQGDGGNVGEYVELSDFDVVFF